MTYASPEVRTNARSVAVWHSVERNVLNSSSASLEPSEAGLSNRRR